jgi:hypothetical protein
MDAFNYADHVVGPISGIAETMPEITAHRIFDCIGVVIPTDCPDGTWSVQGDTGNNRRRVMVCRVATLADGQQHWQLEYAYLQ